MKKIFWVFFLLIILAPAVVGAIGNPTAGKPLVTCDGPNCTIEKFFEMIGRIYNFIVWDIATLLATLALLIGGIIMIISAGSPGLATLGRRILFVTIIGIVLVFGAWLIVNTILVALTGHGIQ